MDWQKELLHCQNHESNDNDKSAFFGIFYVTTSTLMFQTTQNHCNKFIQNYKTSIQEEEQTPSTTAENAWMSTKMCPNFYFLKFGQPTLTYSCHLARNMTQVTGNKEHHMQGSMTRNMNCGPDHATLFTVPSVACTGTANRTQGYKWNELTWHLSDHSVMVKMETVSETLGTNSILTKLMTWEDFTEFRQHGSFKSQGNLSCHTMLQPNLGQIWQWKRKLML